MAFLLLLLFLTKKNPLAAGDSDCVWKCPRTNRREGQTYDGIH